MLVRDPKSLVRTEPIPEPEFLANEQDFLKEAQKAWKKIKNEDTWKAWWKIGQALLLVRKGIMRQLNCNEPRGSAYNIAFSRYLDKHFPGLAATKQTSYILWLRSDPEREQLCETLRDQMTPEQRVRITDPNSMAKRVRAYMGEQEGKPRKKPKSGAERIRELEAENAELLPQLADRDFDPMPLVGHWFESTSIHGIARYLRMRDADKARALADELIRRDGEDIPEIEIVVH